MATNLTPQQLAELQWLFSTPVESGDSNAYMPNTVDYGGQSWKKDAAAGFASTGPLYGNNEYHYTNYDTGGAQTAEGEARMSDWDPLQYALMATAGLVGGGLMMGGPGAFGFGANPGYGMVGGATEPVSALGASGGTGAMGAGAAYGTMAPLELIPTSLAEFGIPGEMALAGGAAAGGAAGAASGLLGKALGPAATLLGAAAGAQGQNAEQTTAKDIPEWLKPYAMKQLGYAGGLLDKQMAPGYMQGYDQMRTVGQGLLSQPIAGNGVAQFQAMPRFGR